MIRTDKLRGIMAEKHYSQADMARTLGMAPITFYRKMKKGVFGSDDIQTMIEILDIENPSDIFFAHE